MITNNNCVAMCQVSMTFSTLVTVTILLYGLVDGKPANLIEKVEQERAKRAMFVGGVPYANPAALNTNGGTLVIGGGSSNGFGYMNGQRLIPGVNAGGVGYYNGLANTIGNGTVLLGGGSSWGSMSSEGIFIVNNNNAVTETPTPTTATSSPGRKRRAIALANAPYYGGGSSNGFGYMNGQRLIPGVNAGGVGYYNGLANTVGNGTVLLGGGSSWGSMSSEGIFIINNNDAVTETPTPTTATSSPGRKRRAIALANAPYYGGGYMNRQRLIPGVNAGGVGYYNGLANTVGNGTVLLGGGSSWGSMSSEGIFIINNNDAVTETPTPTTATSSPGRKRRAIALANAPYYGGGYMNRQRLIPGVNAGGVGYYNGLANTVGNGTLLLGGGSSWGSMSSEGIFIVNNIDAVTETPTPTTATSSPGRKRRAIALANAPYYGGGSSNGFGYMNGQRLIPGVNAGGVGYYNGLANTVGNGTFLLGGGSSWGSMSSEGIFIVNNNDAVTETPTPTTATSSPGRKRRAIALANAPYYGGGSSNGFGYMNGQRLIPGVNAGGVGYYNGLANTVGNGTVLLGGGSSWGSMSSEGIFIVNNNDAVTETPTPATLPPVDLTQTCACTPSQCVTYLMLQESCMGSLGDITRCEKQVDLDFLCDELKQRLGLSSTAPTV